MLGSNMVGLCKSEAPSNPNQHLLPVLDAEAAALSQTQGSTSAQPRLRQQHHSQRQGEIWKVTGSSIARAACVPKTQTESHSQGQPDIADLMCSIHAYKQMTDTQFEPFGLQQCTICVAQLAAEIAVTKGRCPCVLTFSASINTLLNAQHDCTVGSPEGLEFLSLAGCPKVTDKGLTALLKGSPAARSLTSLDVSRCISLSENALDLPPKV